MKNRIDTDTFISKGHYEKDKKAVGEILSAGGFVKRSGHAAIIIKCIAYQIVFQHSGGIDRDWLCRYGGFFQGGKTVFFH